MAVRIRDYEWRSAATNAAIYMYVHTCTMAISTKCSSACLLACLLAGAFSLIHPSIYRVGWWHIYTLYEVCIAGPNPPSAAAAVAVAANI